MKSAILMLKVTQLFCPPVQLYSRELKWVYWTQACFSRLLGPSRLSTHYLDHALSGRLPRFLKWPLSKHQQHSSMKRSLLDVLESANLYLNGRGSSLFRSLKGTGKGNQELLFIWPSRGRSPYWSTDTWPQSGTAFDLGHSKGYLNRKSWPPLGSTSIPNLSDLVQVMVFASEANTVSCFRVA